MRGFREAFSVGFLVDFCVWGGGLSEASMEAVVA